LHIEYGQDPIDLLTHDAIPRYSSTAAFTSDNTVTPLLKGNETIVSDFGATRFLDDGITESYISAAINNPLVYLGVFAVIFLIALIIANALGLIASLTVGAAVGVLITTAGVVLLTSAIGYIAGSVYLAGTTTYAIVASQDIWTMGKIVTWDETSAPADAVVKDYGAGSTKLPNLLYNPTGQSYDTVHTENAVIPTTTLRNYNNFADCRFQETLWDDFMTKDPRVSANANREVTITFAACCEELVALGLFQNLEVAISRIVSYAGLMPSRVGEVANNSAVIKTIKVDYYTQVVEIIGYEYVEQ
jgi:hypothetical protein